MHPSAISTVDLLFKFLNDEPDLDLLSKPGCWDRIEREAHRFGVAPLIAYTARPHVSAEKRAWCDRVLADSWLQYDQLLQKLRLICGLLSEAGIRTIALKGPVLAQRYYSPAFLRKPSMDLDLAVCDKDVERACKALQNAGYSLEWPISHARAHSHHVELLHTSLPHVELHFRLSHRALGIRVEEFFDRAVPFRFPDGYETLMLAPADQLLHIALHLGHSRFGSVFHFCEMRRAWKSEPAVARNECIRRAIEHRYCGVFQMLDVAFRARWSEPLLAQNPEVPKTWLSWRLSEKTFKDFESWSTPGRELSIAHRVHGRMLDLQLTDSMPDAARLALFFARTALHNLSDSKVRTMARRIRFAPPLRT